MAFTKQTARKSTKGMAPRKQLAFKSTQLVEREDGAAAQMGAAAEESEMHEATLFLPNRLLVPTPSEWASTTGASTAAAAFEFCKGKAQNPKRSVKYWTGDERPWRADDNTPIEDDAVIAEEETQKAAVEREDEAFTAEDLRSKGVDVSFLLALTFFLDLWEWKTWEVVAHLVKPLTEEGNFEQRRRCRFADVAQVKPFTGPASVFMSHCWGGKWGDLVAAACQGARRDRRVWIDVFAVRQWPGNSKDLDFRGVISGVQGVIVASPPLHGGKVAEAFLYNDALRAEYLSSAEYLEASRVLPFCRLWCIVEFYAALASGKPLIFKCGTTQLQTGGGSVKVVSGDAAVEMLENFSRMVDVATAECAVPADKEREMALIDAATVNSMVSKAMTLGMVAVAADVFEVDAHLCGEPEALAAELSEERTFAVLQVACSAGLLDVVANLLDRCGDGGGGGGGGRSLLEGEYYPLFIAASLSHVKVVQMLVDKGADVNQANTDGDTPLKIAAQQGHLEVVGFLVDKGANVNYADKDGVTPLKISAQKGHVGVVNLLLDKGAEVNHADVDGVTSLFMAAQEGHFEVVGLLVDKGANFDQTGNDGDFPLKIAAQQGHMEVVGLLVDKGANVNHADTSGVTPLFMAAQKGHVDVVALLVDKGANVNYANNDGVTPVSIAAQGGYTKVVALLSNKGAHLGAHGAAGLLVAVDF